MANAKIDGYELCVELLPDLGGIDFTPLINKARRREAEWLEFKASCEAPIVPTRTGHNASDYRWHVARAVYSLANTCGGCLLLGVDDDGKAVGLEGCDPKGIIDRDGMDAFLRHLSQTVFFPEKGWSCEKAGNIRPESPFPQHLVRLCEGKLDGRPVVAVLVKPVAEGEDCLYLKECKNNRESSFLPVRDLGHVGRVRNMTSIAEIKKWEKARTTKSAELAALLPKKASFIRRRVWIISTVISLCSIAAWGWLVPKETKLPEVVIEEGELEFARMWLGKEENVVVIFMLTKPENGLPETVFVPETLLKNIAVMCVALAATHKEQRFWQSWFGEDRRRSGSKALAAAVSDLSKFKISYLKVDSAKNPSASHSESQNDIPIVGRAFSPDVDGSDRNGKNVLESGPLEMFRIESSGIIAEIRGDFRSLVDFNARKIEKDLYQALIDQGLEVSKE